MDETMEILEFHKNPLYILCLITLIGLLITIYLFKISSTSKNITLIITFLLVYGIYYVYNNQCPNCKRIFTKHENIEWRKELGVKKEPYGYYSRKIIDEDGIESDDESSWTSITRKRKYTQYFYTCNKCKFGSEKEWTPGPECIWLGPDPKIKIIKSKNFRKNNNKKRIPVPIKIKREVYSRAKNSCQHCGIKHSLEIHHIDENPSNNKLNNLILLCANDHRNVGSLSKIALQGESKKFYGKKVTINKIYQSK